ncbi:MAG: class I SAM-dependent methyltransferase [Bdellovibrionales bacterium]
MLDENFYYAYQRYARFYNFYFGKVMNPGRIKAIEFAKLQPGEKVLEVGVGTGLSLPFYPRNVELTGIDLSPHMLNRAKKLVIDEELSNVKALEIMNAEAMTFADNSFDCVMAMHVSTVVGNAEKFADEMRRVCKPGGRIVIVNYFHDPDSAFGMVSGLLAPYARLIGFRHDLTLKEFLQRTKFVIDKSVPVNLFKMHDVFLVRNNK